MCSGEEERNAKVGVERRHFLCYVMDLRPIAAAAVRCVAVSVGEG